MKNLNWLIGIVIVASLFVFVSFQTKLFSSVGKTNNSPLVQHDTLHSNNPYYSRTDTNRIQVSNAEWKKILSPALYAVSREKDTEPAFEGTYWKTNLKGTYYCAACGNCLFKSDAKFASSCGWPSFFEQIRKNSVVFQADHSYGMDRMEALCGRCGGHLGHLFDDGPAPTGKRYCMNSICLEFVPD